MKAVYSFVLTFAVALLVLSLSGCSSPAKLVVKTSTKYQEVPGELTLAIKPAAPVDKVVYLTMPLYQREQYLSGYSVDLLKSLYSCNAQLEAISTLSKQWKAQPSDGVP